MKKSLAYMSCLILFFVSQVVAQGHLVLDSELDVDFKPDQAYFLVSLDSKNFFVQQGVLSHTSDSGGIESWRVGGVVRLAEKVETLRYSVLAKDEDGHFWIHHYPEERIGDSHYRLASIDAMRDKLLIAKSDLKGWDEKLSVDKDMLRRLRADAEVIGNLGRITRLMEQIDLFEKEQKRLLEDKERLELFLKQASSQEEPKNFIRRQAELTSQLEELARAVRGVEEGEETRRSLSEAELQQKLALIEETRFADASDLESQLRQLQSARLRLEKELGFDEGETVENYLSW